MSMGLLAGTDPPDQLGVYATVHPLWNDDCDDKVAPPALKTLEPGTFRERLRQLFERRFGHQPGRDLLDRLMDAAGRDPRREDS
jgi:hypothetical protein